MPLEAEPSSTEASHPPRDAAQPRTINPSLLEKTAEHNGVPQAKFTFDQPMPKRLPAVGQGDTLLFKAKEMGMKVWQAEKVQRILNVMAEEVPSPTALAPKPRVQRAVQVQRQSRQQDLGQLIKNEQLNGPAEKEGNLLGFDVIPFKGYHIYIKDMNEKTKPVLVRDYPKVQNREDGEWPQFRSVTMGKCPFIEEDVYSRRRHEKERACEEARKQRAVELKAPRTRASTAARMEPPPYAGRKRPLNEVDNNANCAPQPQQLPDAAPENEEFTKPPAPGVNGPFAGQPGNGGREPMASGLQASNVTSAIRSQMVSSTAAVPGAKAGTSKEIHGLQRKVLERNTGPVAAALQPSRRMAEIAGARANPRAAKQKAQEKMGGTRLTQIHEDSPSENENEPKKPSRPNASRVLRKEKRDPKPGYCENCREKFEDFDEVSCCWRRDCARIDSMLAHSFETTPQVRNHERQLERA